MEIERVGFLDILTLLGCGPIDRLRFWSRCVILQRSHRDEQASLFVFLA
jgi:hypothetical protein